jgi:hypothetical protein
LQTKLKVLQPLTEFEDQTEENGEAFPQLRVEESVKGLVLGVPKLARRRWLSPSFP